MAIDETLALRAQIEALSGKISARRADASTSASTAAVPTPWAGRGRGARGGYQAPYGGGRGRGRGRGGGGGVRTNGMQWVGGAGVRNKTLVLNQSSSSSADATAAQGATSSSSAALSTPQTADKTVATPSATSASSNPAVPSGFVKRHERGSMSLVTSDTYKKLEAARVAAKPSPKTRRSLLEKKRRDREIQAKMARLQQHSKVLSHMQTFRNAKGTTGRPGADGSRSAQAQKGLCAFFTRTGKCKRGLTCAYKHDASKLAICPCVLSAQGCTRKAQGKQCLLSHTPNAHRVPHCAFYTRYRTCKNDTDSRKCVYTHSDKVSPETKPCEQFTKLGYCEKGKECEWRHTFECPEFAETGKCSKPACRLMHIVSSAGGAEEEGDADGLVFERDDAAALGTGEDEEMEDGSSKKKGKRKREDGEGDLSGDEGEDDVEDFSNRPLKKHHGKSFIAQQDFISFGDVSDDDDDEEDEDEEDKDEEDKDEEDDDDLDDDDEEAALGEDEELEGSDEDASDDDELDGASITAGGETEDAFEDAEQGSEYEAALDV
ncbi:hypothetical protein A4X09_0g1476 [Tilletia walkeri]|uniref:C3H1-type domain-containing protein n=1 Tax=Tilletia walkeri TaxID=117179 RepID=A0A8X7NF60_9BASI|nr:hypothetical protein A4X09_0g1476 [Tilletia walkeri]